MVVPSESPLPVEVDFGPFNRHKATFAKNAHACGFSFFQIMRMVRNAIPTVKEFLRKRALRAHQARLNLVLSAIKLVESKMAPPASVRVAPSYPSPSSLPMRVVPKSTPISELVAASIATPGCCFDPVLVFGTRPPDLHVEAPHPDEDEEFEDAPDDFQVDEDSPMPWEYERKLWPNKRPFKGSLLEDYKLQRKDALRAHFRRELDKYDYRNICDRFGYMQTNKRVWLWKGSVLSMVAIPTWWLVLAKPPDLDSNCSGVTGQELAALNGQPSFRVSRVSGNPMGARPHKNQVQNSLPAIQCNAKPEWMGSSRSDAELASYMQEQAKEDYGQGKLPSVSELTRDLRARKPLPQHGVRNATEGKVAKRGEDPHLELRDVYSGYDRSLSSKLSRYLSRKGGSRDIDYTEVDCISPVSSVVVNFPEKPEIPIYSILPPLTEEKLRKLADKHEFSHMSVDSLDIGAHCYTGPDIPVAGFHVIMDGINDDPNYASMVGFYSNFGNQKIKALTMPGKNYAMQGAFDRCEDPAGGIYLCSYINDLCGYRPGVPMLSYGTRECQEYRDSTYSAATKKRDDFDAVINHQAKLPRRVVAGLNLEGTVSQEKGQKASEFPDFVLRCRPTINSAPHINLGGKEPIVAEFSKPPKPLQMRAFSFREGNWKQGLTNASRGSFPLSGVEPGRTSTCNSRNIMDCLCYEEITIPKDAKDGTQLKAFSIRESALTFGSVATQTWITKKIIHPVFEVTLTFPKNPFLGLSLGVWFDWYNDFPFFKLSGKVPTELFNNAPQAKYCPISAGPVQTFRVDMRDIAGHGMYIHDKAFADPQVRVFAITDNDVPAAEAWVAAIQVHLVDDSVGEFTYSPRMSLPFSLERLHLDLWKGPFRSKLGERTHVKLFLNMCAKTEHTPGKTFLAPTAAYLSPWQGFGGKIKGRVVKLGTCLTNASIMVSSWYRDHEPSVQWQWKVPHVLLENGEGPFELEISSPYGTISGWDKGPMLYFYIYAGPNAADKVTSPFEFVVYLEMLDTMGRVGKPLFNNSQVFVWCTYHNIVVDDLTIVIPARIYDILSETDKYDVELDMNPFARIVATSGFFSGEVDFIFEWSLRDEITKVKGSITTTVGFGDHDGSERGTRNNTSLSALCASVLNVQIGHFSGYTQGTKHSFSENWVRLRCAQAKFIDKISLSLRVHNFDCYGRRLAAIKV
uniref:Polyprotein n=1 Tax=Purple sand food nepovirus TaxID=3115774 RepID=A0AAT9JB07_9SECO